MARAIIAGTGLRLRDGYQSALYAYIAALDMSDGRGIALPDSLAWHVAQYLSGVTAFTAPNHYRRVQLLSEGSGVHRKNLNSDFYCAVAVTDAPLLPDPETGDKWFSVKIEQIVEKFSGGLELGFRTSPELPEKEPEHIECCTVVGTGTGGSLTGGNHKPEVHHFIPDRLEVGDRVRAARTRRGSFLICVNGKLASRCSGVPSLATDQPLYGVVGVYGFTGAISELQVSGTGVSEAVL
eukprot:TRINITY_DN2970_c1_g2_i1.p1 TRINITY_DN2970_c1_g2~~TRINITY_DN2970_c1_g2_i1.p1  ORF type:complete len:251 (-),score=41.91 TRINITY_DN2970_c1_g2_i1:114-827(-)